MARVSAASEYGGNVTGAARNLLKVLGERLTSSEKEREAEAAAFNQKLCVHAPCVSAPPTDPAPAHCVWLVDRSMTARCRTRMLRQCGC